MQAEFARRRRRQWLITGPFLIGVGLLAACRMASAQGRTTLGGVPITPLLLGVTAVCLLAAVLSRWNWRCPACNAALGRAAAPRCCPACGVELRPEREWDTYESPLVTAVRWLARGLRLAHAALAVGLAAVFGLCIGAAAGAWLETRLAPGSAHARG